MHKQTIMPVLGGTAGAMLMALFLYGLTTFAAPTQAPPNGNPVFPLTGPQGPAGAQGPQGPAGPSGTSTLNCTQVTSYAWTSQSYTVSCPSGYLATGGGFYLSDGNNNGLNWNDAWARPYNSTTWECGRNVYSMGVANYCYVVCCRAQ